MRMLLQNKANNVNSGMGLGIKMHMQTFYTMFTPLLSPASTEGQRAGVTAVDKMKAHQFLGSNTSFPGPES